MILISEGMFVMLLNVSYLIFLKYGIVWSVVCYAEYTFPENLFIAISRLHIYLYLLSISNLPVPKSSDMALTNRSTSACSRGACDKLSPLTDTWSVLIRWYLAISLATKLQHKSHSYICSK